jgi:hypothetical protein
MTQSDKDLLLKDLCARLPYNVKIKIKTYEDIDEIDSIGTLCQLNKQYFWILEDEYERCVEYNKPYLFPLSSMTEKQRNEYESLCIKETSECGDLTGIFYTKDYYYDTAESIDYLYKNHFDYRGLIPMGLAIDATRLNIY